MCAYCAKRAINVWKLNAVAVFANEFAKYQNTSRIGCFARYASGSKNNNIYKSDCWLAWCLPLPPLKPEDVAEKKG